MAKSALASKMSEKGNTNVTDADIYSSVVSGMQDPGDLGTYRAGLDFRPYGSELASNEDLLNGYMGSLVRQYGVIFQKVAMAQNPLNLFKRGIMPLNGKIESMVYDTVDPKIYNPFYKDSHGNPQSPFEQSFNDPIGRTYTEEQDISTPTTIIDSVDTEFFQNLDQFHSYLYNRILALVNGAIIDEFKLTKLTLSEPLADNVMPNYNIKRRSDPAETSKQIAKKILKTARMMRYFSRDFNGLGINQASVVDDIVVVMNLNYSVDIDMDYFGQLFNPENGQDFRVERKEIDNFPSVWRYTKDHVVTQEDIDKKYADGKIGGSYGTWYVGDTIKAGALAKAGAPDAEQVLDGDNVAAVILDRDALQVWDKLPLRLSLVSNPRGRYQNVLLNKKTMFAYVEGLNALAITVSDNEDGKVKYPDVVKPANPGTGS